MALMSPAEAAHRCLWRIQTATDSRLERIYAGRPDELPALVDIQTKADSPVMARPTISACTVSVPSKV
jgi:hypothetical protein